MPCFEVRTTILLLEKADLEIMRKTLERMGFEVRVLGTSLSISRNGGYVGSFSNGRLNIDNRALGGLTEQSLKKAYSAEVVRHGASKFGWGVKETARGFQVQKRSF